MQSDVAKARRHLDQIQRHIFMCIGAECCSSETGTELWQYLKTQLAQLGLSEGDKACVYRTKTGCLRICSDGPIAVVYPEGTWYRNLDKAGIDLIIREHLIGGQPVKSLSLAQPELANKYQDLGDLPE